MQDQDGQNNNKQQQFLLVVEFSSVTWSATSQLINPFPDLYCIIIIIIVIIIIIIIIIIIMLFIIKSLNLWRICFLPYFRLINCRFHLFQSSASCFISQYLLLFLKSSRSCVLLPTTIIPSSALQ